MRRAFVLALGGLVAFAVVASACSKEYGTDPSAEPDAAAEAAPDHDASGAVIGTACTTTSDCAVGTCVDSVCCSTPCDGLCQRCDVSNHVGECTPIASGDDPDKECQGDAGATACGGTCSGNATCSFPDSKTSCGAASCADDGKTENVLQCDGNGSCVAGTKVCSAFVCPANGTGCKTTCTAPADCQTGFYCDGASQTCKPQFANGVGCTGFQQCTSGICDTSGGQGGVCCDTDCSGIAGGTCRAPGKIGQCTCSACNTGACAVYYKDADNDGYGDINGAATYACADATPSGYSRSHDDCLDGVAAVSASVHPNQTQWFSTAYTDNQGTESFDYDCSGTVEKQTSELASCVVCASDALACTNSTSCASAGQKVGHACTKAAVTMGGAAGPAPAEPCTVDNTPVFGTPVACGASGTLSTCADCTAANTAPTTVVSAGAKVQLCH